MAPRPFAVEPIGGWLGRVAARYRGSVDELSLVYGLELADTDELNTRASKNYGATSVK